MHGLLSSMDREQEESVVPNQTPYQHLCVAAAAESD